MAQTRKQLRESITLGDMYRTDGPHKGQTFRWIRILRDNEVVGAVGLDMGVWGKVNLRYTSSLGTTFSGYSYKDEMSALSAARKFEREHQEHTEAEAMRKSIRANRSKKEVSEMRKRVKKLEKEISALDKDIDLAETTLENFKYQQEGLEAEVKELEEQLEE